MDHRDGHRLGTSYASRADRAHVGNAAAMGSSARPARQRSAGVALTTFAQIGGIQMLTLYFAPGSSSMAAHIALHEVGAPFESRPISLSKKENREPAFLDINREC